MKRFTALVLFAVVMVFAACRETPSGLVAGTGTIYLMGNECRGWLLVADSGRQYELTALDAAFQRNALRVRFVLKKRTDRVSTCVRGEGADVVSMRKL